MINFLRQLSVFSIALLYTTISFAQAQTSAKAVNGFSQERLNRIDSVMSQSISDRKIPGMVMLVMRHGKLVYNKALGKSDIAEGKPMSKDAMFRIASMTKAITSVAAMMLYEQGRFLLTDPVSKYIPEFKSPRVISISAAGDTVLLPAKSEITIRQLLNHTSGITYGGGLQESFYKKAGMTVGLTYTGGSLKDKILALAKLPLASHPGEEFHYGMSTDVLGYLIEVVSGMSLDEYLKRAVLSPLRMNETSFNIPREKSHRLAGLYKLNAGGTLEKVTTYFPYPDKQTYFAGGAGLVSTAMDYSRFAQMLLNEGELDGVRILSRKTIEAMTSNSIKDLYIFNPFKHNGIMGDKFGLGFGIRTERGEYDELESMGLFGWDGAFYTRFWVDRKEDLVGIFLSQMDSNWNDKLIGKFKVLVYQAIND